VRVIRVSEILANEPGTVTITCVDSVRKGGPQKKLFQQNLMFQRNKNNGFISLCCYGGFHTEKRRAQRKLKKSRKNSFSTIKSRPVVILGDNWEVVISVNCIQFFSLPIFVCYFLLHVMEVIPYKSSCRWCCCACVQRKKLKYFVFIVRNACMTQDALSAQ